MRAVPLRRLARVAAWGLAATAAWYAYAWLTAGWWALPLIAGAHAVDAWREGRRPAPPPVPGARRHHYAAVSAQVLAVTALLALVGYRPDWLIGGALAVSAVLRWGDHPAADGAAGRPDGG